MDRSNHITTLSLALIVFAAFAVAGCSGVVTPDGGADVQCASSTETRCAGVCVDSSSDRLNCGACGNSCSAAQVCNDGVCGEPRLDLLVVVDNSNSMRDNETNIMTQLQAMVGSFISPSCTNPTNPVPHQCDRNDPNEVPQYPPLTDIHVGVVSSDLGTPGASIPGCSNSETGDDGLLNPIRNGQALAHHEPWTVAPPTFERPMDCMDPNEYPSFISFTSGIDPLSFTHDFQCNAGVFANGCGGQSQLETIYRALITHDARTTAGNISPNMGFVRDDAFLAIVMITDQEDGSVRNCQYANGMACDPAGASSVYSQSVLTEWVSGAPMRFYTYQPCGSDDPMWRLERYVDPANPSGGLLALKPGHPERVIFSAIVGVPLNIPTTSSGEIHWDQLLGTPGPGGADDYCNRDSSMLGHIDSAEGPVSMQQGNRDPNCPHRVVPACRRGGSTYLPTACTTDLQYFAQPSRRIVEIARRFDQSPLCHGAACRNGSVTSVCGTDYREATRFVVDRVRGQM